MICYLCLPEKWADFGKETYRLALVIGRLIFNDLIDDSVKAEPHVEQVESEKQTSQYVLQPILIFLQLYF